jgi:hypothetical protein
VRYNEDYGAMLIDASDIMMRLQFINRQGMGVDAVELVKPPSH